MRTLKDISKDNAVVPLRSIGGGKEEGKNWLEELPINTVFLARPKASRSASTLPYGVLHKFKVATKMEVRYDEGTLQRFYHTADFSRENELVEILVIPPL